MTRPYLHFEDMTWPNPEHASEVGWTLRYGKPTRADFLQAASVINAYQQLIDLPRRDRDSRVASIRRAMREGS